MFSVVPTPVMSYGFVAQHYGTGFPNQNILALFNSIYIALTVKYEFRIVKIKVSKKTKVIT